MNITKYAYVSAVTFLIALSNSPVAFSQTITRTLTALPTLDPASILDPALAPAPAPVLDPAPAPAPAPALDTASTQTNTTTIENGTVYEDHVGRGKKNGMDNGKKKGHDKDHHEQNAHSDKLIMSGTISGNTLNVTSINSGHLEIGTVLSGEGIPQPVKIIAFGTGKGGIGTYTIINK